MSKIAVNGGAALYGNVRLSGSKNASLPCIFASLAMKGCSYIHNLPDIGDVRVALRILESFGAKIEIEGSTVKIDTANTFYTEECAALAPKLRASTYLLGASLAAFGRARIMDFGGCNFSFRPIDIHLEACAAFGAEITADVLTAPKLRAADFSLRVPSVGATVNALILAAQAEGHSVIRGAALEPHIDTLIEFLVSAGARIYREGDNIEVYGTKLACGTVTVPPDAIEAGTFLASSLVSGGSVRVPFSLSGELHAFLEVLRGGGTRVVESGGYISLEGLPSERISVQTAPYPGFPTDLQPILAVILAKGRGGVIEERVWEGRFGYLLELARQGLSYRLIGNKAEIFPSEFIPADVVALDLRGGAASVIAALCAQGKSTVERAELVMRGYDGFTEKLARLGADIEKYE